MAEPKKATQLPITAATNSETDYFMVVRGNAGGPSSGPSLVPIKNVVVATDGGTGGGGTGGTVELPDDMVLSVFGRPGPTITAAAGDYDASQISFNPASSGLPASNLEVAINAVAALSSTLDPPTNEGDVLTGDGSGNWTSQPPLITSIFGREGVVDAATGDYHADQIATVKLVGGDPNTATTNQFVTAGDKTKLATLDAARQIPAGGTTGQALKKVSGTDYDVSWQDDATGGGGGGSLSQIDLMPFFRPDSAAPPNWAYVSGTGFWEFSSASTQGLFCEIGYWPGGTVTLDLTVGCSVTTGNAGFSCQIAAVTPDSADLFDKALATANTGNIAVADATKKTKRLSITLSNLDSAAAGDLVRIKLARDNTVGSNAAGLATLRGATLRFS